MAGLEQMKDRQQETHTAELPEQELRVVRLQQMRDGQQERHAARIGFMFMEEDFNQKDVSGKQNAQTSMESITASYIVTHNHPYTQYRYLSGCSYLCRNGYV